MTEFVKIYFIISELSNASVLNGKGHTRDNAIIIHRTHVNI
jgi:hypothetical protein